MNDFGEAEFLKDPLSLPELIQSGAHFEINCEFNDRRDSDDLLDLENENDDNIDWDEECEKIVSPWLHPFEELKAQMVEINPYIYKYTVRQGDPIKGKVPLNARVKVRYNAYWENEGAPFDSSYLRGSSYVFNTGCNAVLEGLELAVLTMLQGEHAQFVISYQILFGELGCPPRIKPKADGLFVIEVVEFSVVGDADADKHLTDEEKSKFKYVIDKAKDIHLKGLDFFGQKMYKESCTTFQKVSRLLTFCSVENDEEEKIQKEFLIKLNTNMAVCYLKMNQPGKTCIMIRELKQLTNNQLSCKALFQEGKALCMLGDYLQARKILLKCMAMEPNNSEVTKELIALDKRYGDYKRQEKDLWLKAMKFTRINPNEANVKQIKSDEADGKQAEDYMVSILEDFKRNFSLKELKLPDNLTENEVKSIDDLAKQMSLKLKIVPTLNETSYLIVK